MPSRSRSNDLLCMLVAALAVTGCRSNCSEFAEQQRSVAIVAPGGAAWHIVSSGPDDIESMFTFFVGEAQNRSDEPCRLAIYRHSAEPTPADLPILTADHAAPVEIAAQGTLLFETLLPGVRPGEVLVRPIHDFPQQDLGLDDTRGLSVDDDIEDPTIDSWLTLATCAAPNIAVDLTFRPESCFYSVKPRNKITIESVWPDS